MEIGKGRRVKASGLVRAGVIGALLLGLCLSPAYAEKVKLNTSTQGGFARLLFKFSSSPTVKADIENGVLVARFDRPIEIDIRKLRRGLGQYVALVRQDSDGRVLRLALTQGFRLHTSAADHRVAIDIIPPRYAGTPAGIKPRLTRKQIEARKKAAELAARETARGPIEMRPIKVNVGQRAAYSRISFAWQEPVAYTAVLKNGKIHVTFKQPADPDIVELRVDPPAFVLTAEKTVTDKSLVVDITVIPGAGLRHFRDGNRVVIDVLKPEEKPLGGDAEVILSSRDTRHPAPEKGESTHATDAHPAQDEQVKDVKSDPAPERMAQGEETPPSRHPPREPDVQQEASSEHTTSSPAQAEPDRLSEAPENLSNNTGSEQLSSEVRKTDGAVRGADLEKEPATPRERRVDAAIEQDEVGESPPPDTPQIIEVAGYDQGDNLRLTFRWGHNVAAAFFRRGTYLWMIFDDPAPTLDFSLVDREFRQFIHSIDSEIVDGARVVRLGIADHLLITVVSEEGAWVVTLGEKILKPTIPLELTTAINYRFEPVINIPMRDYGIVHHIKDPEVGDELIIVTAKAPTRGLITAQKFVEFTTLRSAHGLVLRPLSDNVFVRPIEGGIEISHSKGLSLSEHELRTAVDGHVPLGSQTVPAYMDFDKWKLGPFEKFSELEQGLLSEIARVTDVDDRNVSVLAWIKLARFYLAHDMSQEALGVLELVDRQDDEAATDPAFLALRGVAYFITRRYDDALNDFNNSSLNEDVDAALWRGATQAELGHFIKARREFSKGKPAMLRYTDQWQNYFHLLSAKAALAVNDIEQVEWNLGKLSGEHISPSVRADAEYVRGEMLEALGRDDEAVARYSHVIKVAQEPIAVKARFSRTSDLYRTGKIDVAQAIENLESLRFQWRGGPLELAVLQRLGELYVDQGDYRHGLNIMRETVISYPDSPAARKISTSMGEIFKKLFLEESFNDMTPVRALAVFYEFRELTPVGRDGDAMIRKLVNRLVSVDLLDQAAALLDHQVRNRLRGIARAQVATRLAMIYLMDRKPEKALQIIRNTRLAGIPESLVYSRRLLESRALADLGRYAHALELIEQYHAVEAEQIRADVYWESQDWPKAAANFEDLLGDRWQEDKPLGKEDRQTVMKSAVAYSLAGDQEGLDRLRVRYGAKMSKSDDASSFEIVTQDIDSQGIEFRKLATSIAAIDTLDAFMTSFRKQFQVSDTALN